MKLKLLITTLVLAALFSGVVLWRVDRFIYGDRMAWAEAQARSQLSSLSQAISAEIRSARRMLGTVTNDSFKRETANWKAFQPYYALALMTSQGGSLSISRMVSKADSPAATWTANDLSQYIGFMGKELESKGKVLLRSFRDPKKNHHIAVIFAGGGNAYILVGSGENFQSLIESQKGSISAFSIIASDGLMISHPVRDYIGSVMSDSTLLKEIRSTSAAHGLGTYLQGKQKIFGMYDLVPGTNTYVMSTVPTADLLKGRLSLAWQFGFMLIGLGFIGAAIYFWQEKRLATQAAAPIEAPVAVSAPAAPAAVSFSPDMSGPVLKNPKDMPTITVPPAPPKSPKVLHDDVVISNANLNAPPAPKESVLEAVPPVPVPVPTSQVVSPQEMQSEKAEAYRQVAAALGHEMRAPLASILGFSQMVLAKTQEPEVVQAVESILREARSSRDVLEKLFTFSGERISEKATSKIEGPLMQALKNLDAQIQQKGVRIEKDFQATSPWPLASADMTKAFENLFLNAIEAMERMQDKLLKISVWEAADGLHIRVADNGEGIEMENVAKVFDPFFTTRSFSQHVGLGLPVVLGILKEHQGQVQIQSQRGKGTQVDIVLAPAQLEAPPLEVSMSPRETTAPDLPLDLPKVSVPSEEDLALHDEALVETAKAAPKLTDVNVDTLLDMQGDELPLQFLDGQGFDETTSPGIELPEAATPRPTKPVVPPPVTAKGEAPEALSPKPPPAVPPPPPPAGNSAPTPPAFDFNEQDEDIAETAAASKSTPTMVIDKPASPPKASKPSELDSYKVAVRRPGKRN